MLEDVLPTSNNGSESVTMTMTSPPPPTPSVVVGEEESHHHPSASEILAKFQLNFNSAQSSLEEGEDDGETEKREEEEGTGSISASTTSASAATCALSDHRIFGRDFFFSCWLPMILEMGLEAYTAAQSLIVRVLPVATWYWVMSDSANANEIVVGPSNAWPPPGLVRLAVLTILTLIVHPDGYTWVILRKIRDALYYVLHASSSFWSIVIHDYGAFLSTLFALSTFACMFFLAYLLRKTLKSKSIPTTKQKQPVKKKRRNNKGHHHHHHHHHHSRRAGGSQRAGGGVSHAQQLGSEEAPTTNVLPVLLEDRPVSPPLSSTTCLLPPADDDGIIQSCSDHDDPAPTVQEQSTSKVSYRDRVLTEDSTVVSCSDDLSYDSVSGRSTPTMAADSSSSHQASSSPSQQGNAGVTANSSSDRGATATVAKVKPRTNRRKKQEAAVIAANVRVIPPVSAPKISSSVTHQLPTNPAPPTAPSRWEVLKPSRRQQQHPHQQQQQRSRVAPYRFQQSSLVNGPMHRPNPPPPHEYHQQQPCRSPPLNTHRRTDKPHDRNTKQQQQSETLETDTFATSFFSRPATTESNYFSNNSTGDSIPHSVPPPPTASQSTLYDGGLYYDSVFSSSRLPSAPTVYDSPARESINASETATPFDATLSSAVSEQQHTCTSLFSSSWTRQQHASTSSSWIGGNSGVASTAMGALPLGAAASIPLTSPASAATIRAPPGLAPPPPPLSMHLLSGLTTSTTTSSSSAPVVSASSMYSSSFVRENPFDDENDDDQMIEAELQELGGQMVGSILDF